jgi:hypothetical protein
MIEWAKDGTTPVVCDKCSSVYMVEIDLTKELDSEEMTIDEDMKRSVESITDIPVGESVVIDNNEHPQHDEDGIVIQKDDFHYRIEFVSGPMTNQKVWIPYHWVKKKEKR